MNILVLNAGSSSQKCFLYEIREPLPSDPPEPVWQAKVDWSAGKSVIEIAAGAGPRRKTEIPVDNKQQSIAALFPALWSGETRVISGPSEIDAVGHRIVMGGAEYRQPTIITPAVKDAIRRMAAFAPLHNRVELSGIEDAEKQFPNARQAAVFDTGFHSQMPEEAYVYAGPYEWLADGIRRFGFHGINHQYCAQRAAHLMARDVRSLKLVTCHLGNGCSLAAIRDGHSVDTTMGFTPLEGLVMGTRSGSVDPGILTYLMREQKLDGAQLDELLNKNSGLLGLSGVSGNMREVIVAMKGGRARAKLAFDVFIHRLRAEIGAMAASLGGLDALIFSAGIGENSPEVRREACSALAFLGVRIEQEKNDCGLRDGDCDISAKSSKACVFVIRAQEDWAIARECWRLLSRSKGTV